MLLIMRKSREESTFVSDNDVSRELSAPDSSGSVPGRMEKQRKVFASTRLTD
jgi:hypothetical protein